MWSYKRNDGETISGLQPEEVRAAIKEGKINEDTLLKSFQFPEWQPAKNLFFQKNKNSLPHEKSAAAKPNIPVFDSPIAHSSSFKKYLFPLVFWILLVACQLPLAYLNVKIYLQQSRISELEVAALTVKERELDHQQDKIELAALQKELSETQEVFSEKEGEEELEKRVLQSLEEKIALHQTRLQNYAMLPADTNYSKLIHFEQQELDRFNKQIYYFLIPLLLPFLLAIPQFFAATRLLVKAPQRQILAIFHSIPGLHLLFYALVSAIWNIEGAQRKNNLLITFPLSLAASFCFGLAFYLFPKNLGYSVTSIILTAILWGILHSRQSLMISYAKQHNLGTAQK